MECDGCGAALGPTDIACRYCRRATPHAARQQAEASAKEAQASAAREAATAREQATVRQELDKVSKRALIFALVGTVTCLLPVFSIISVVSYLRARKLSRQLGADVPGLATFGFLLSVFWLVVSPAFLVWAFVRDSAAKDRADQRIAVLETQVAAGVQAATLDWATACALAELHALKTGHAGEQGKHLVHFDCVGTLGGTPARPSLDRFTFGEDNSNKRFEVAACFERGARWYVKELAAGRACSP
jgi:hypothetical protein